MNNGYEVYKDIAMRTGGDIYVGVVGPVRTGKSTLITKILNMLVLPNMVNSYNKERTIDEMPQSGAGKTILTMQPNFIPNQAVEINLQNNASMRVRLIDCVGYLVDGVMGHIENNMPRRVLTPWNEQELPFAEAAELGTNKVITNHSTVGIVVTTDGSFTDIPRNNYVPAEERVIRELKACHKPFTIILNTNKPYAPETQELCNNMQDKYGVEVLALDVNHAGEAEINKIFASVLNEFPLQSFCVNMPKWLSALPFNNTYIQEILTEISEVTKDTQKVGDIKQDMVLFANHENYEPMPISVMHMGEGIAEFEVVPKPHLFYKVLSHQCGCEITSDHQLVSYIKQLAVAKKEYDKFKEALEQVKATGYGIVAPTQDDLALDEPKIVKNGNRFGVKLKASAPSYHIMQVNIETEVNPIVGSEQQSEELVKYMLSEFENDPKSLWETKMFGKSLSSLVNEGLQSKLYSMPAVAQAKLKKTLTRIVNEGKGGVICILL